MRSSKGHVGFRGTTTRSRADHRELTVDHVFRFAERCEYLGVIGDAAQPITTKKMAAKAADLAKGILANYNRPA